MATNGNENTVSSDFDPRSLIVQCVSDGRLSGGLIKYGTRIVRISDNSPVSALNMLQKRADCA